MLKKTVFQEEIEFLIVLLILNSLIELEPMVL